MKEGMENKNLNISEKAQKKLLTKEFQRLIGLYKNQKKLSVKDLDEHLHPGLSSPRNFCRN